MKYYGSIYKGCAAKYNTQELQGFDTPYDALRCANNTWDSDPNLQIPRLLIVFEVSDTAGDADIQREAYFQFKDSGSCSTFIKDAQPIIWSSISDQIWNGNARHM